MSVRAWVWRPGSWLFAAHWSIRPFILPNLKIYNGGGDGYGFSLAWLWFEVSRVTA